ncbi:MAG: tetratricopeptide repeat protein [Nitrospiraceae bacterium]|nr:tetratricopeptide repeat protein [Nitrospiraceae bacterium]
MSKCLTKPLLIVLLLLAAENSGIAASSPLQRAWDFVNSGHPADALKLLDGYRPGAAEFGSYHYCYAKALRKAGLPYLSLEHYRLAFLYLKDKKQKELSLLERADTYAEMGFSFEAATAYQVFLNNYGNSALAGKARIKLADSLYKAGDYKRALEAYEKAGKNSDEARYGTANSLEALGEAEKAYAIYSGLKSGNYLKTSPESAYRMAGACIALRKSGEAKTLLNSLKGGAYQYKASLSLGLMAQDEGDSANAERYFDFAARSPEVSVKNGGLLGLAEVCLKQGRTDEARARLNGLLASGTYGRNYYSAMLLYAGVYSQKGEYMKAASILKTAIIEGPFKDDARDRLMAVLARVRQSDPALFVKIWSSTGRLLMLTLRAQSLVETAQALRDLDPKQFLVLADWLSSHLTSGDRGKICIELAEYYANAGDLQNAEFYLRQAGPAKGDDVLRLKAKIAYMNSRYQDAANILARVRDISESDLELYAQLMGKVRGRGAEVFLLRALKTVKKPSPELYARLADGLYREGRKAEALRYYKASVAAGGAGKAQASKEMNWALYRVQAGEKDPKDVLGKLSNATGLLGSYAQARLKELALEDKLNKL